MAKIIDTRGAPAAIGPYSQAVDSGDTVFLSGQIGLDPNLGSLVAGGIAPETRQVMDNIREVLRAAGLGFGDVVKTTIFLVNLADFDTVNRIYGEHFTEGFPAPLDDPGGGASARCAGRDRGDRPPIVAINHFTISRS
jgi:2-iminobutanoate/2-iminopropanoate deaminase